MIFYSPSTNGFYLPGISTAIPDDVVKITSARHTKLIAALAEGATIQAGATGKPKAVLPRPDPEAQRAQLVANIKREAARRIGQISPIWRQINDARSPSPEGARRFAQIDAVRDASTAIEALLADVPARGLAAFPVSDNPAWPEFD